MNSILWAFLAFLVVALTKYMTSLRLRNLQERIHKDQQDANELKRQLTLVAEKESQLKAEIEVVQAKLTALNNINTNLERQYNKLRAAVPQAEADSSDDR